MKRTHIFITGMALAALASTRFTSLASATSKTNFNITEGGAQKGTCIDAGHVESRHGEQGQYNQHGQTDQQRGATLRATMVVDHGISRRPATFTRRVDVV